MNKKKKKNSLSSSLLGLCFYSEPGLSSLKTHQQAHSTPRKHEIKQTSTETWDSHQCSPLCGSVNSTPGTKPWGGRPTKTPLKGEHKIRAGGLFSKTTKLVQCSQQPWSSSGNPTETWSGTEGPRARPRWRRPRGQLLARAGSQSLLLGRPWRLCSGGTARRTGSRREPPPQEGVRRLWGATQGSKRAAQNESQRVPRRNQFENVYLDRSICSTLRKVQNFYKIHKDVKLPLEGPTIDDWKRRWTEDG